MLLLQVHRSQPQQPIRTSLESKLKATPAWQKQTTAKRSIKDPIKIPRTKQPVFELPHPPRPPTPGPPERPGPLGPPRPPVPTPPPSPRRSVAISSIVALVNSVSVGNSQAFALILSPTASNDIVRGITEGIIGCWSLVAKFLRAAAKTGALLRALGTVQPVPAAISTTVTCAAALPPAQTRDSGSASPATSQ